MLCPKCGTESAAHADHCLQCHAPLSIRGFNESPSLEPVVADSTSAASLAPALWKPTIASILSLFLTPIFGAYLQMRNWEALGKPDEVKSARTWLYFSIAMVVVGYSLATAYVQYGAPHNPDARNVANGLPFIYLLVWYFSEGRKQEKYVKQTLGKNYPQKPWLKVVLIGLGLKMIYVLLMKVI